MKPIKKTPVKSITLIGVNFFPEDTAIGLYSTQMMQHLEKKYAINVITGVPYYPQWKIRQKYKKKPKFLKEEYGTIKIFRYRLYVPENPTFIKRIFHLLDFTIGSLRNILKVKNTDIVICVVPFTSTIVLGWVLKKITGAKLWVHIQDFEFDAALQSGVSKKHSILKKSFFKFIFFLERKLLNRADVASTISHTMLQKLKEKTKTNTFYFPNWIDADKIDPGTAQRHAYLKSNKFKILYSGNVGDKQDWELFLKLMPALEKLGGIEMVIIGAGAKYSWLMEQLKENPIVKFYEPVPYHELSDLLCSADLHILFQKTEVLDTVMPSKLLGMMASEVPSIITGNRQSEVKRIIEESKGGIFMETSSVAPLIEKIKELKSDVKKAKKMGVGARKFVSESFDKKVILAHFENELGKLLK